MCVCVRAYVLACLQVCNCNYTIHPQFLIVCFNIFLRLALWSRGRPSRADADTDYYRSSRPITDILNRYIRDWCKNECQN